MRIPTLTRVWNEAETRAKSRGWRKKFAWLPLTVDTTSNLNGATGHRDSWIWLEPYMFRWGSPDPKIRGGRVLHDNRRVAVEKYTAYLLAAQEPS